MEDIQKVCGAFRSLASSVQLHPRERPAAFIRHSDARIAKVLTDQLALVLHLGRISSFTVLPAKGGASPAGCVAGVVNEQSTVFLQVAELVDLSKEAEKQEKKLAAAEKSLQGYLAKMEAPNYEERVPANVREMNASKAAALKQEIEEVKKSVAALRSAC